MSEGKEQLTFLPFLPAVETGFWHKFAEHKLNEIGLSTHPLKIYGTYSNDTVEGVSPLFNVDRESFSGKAPRGSMEGVLLNFNSPEDFKAVDKTDLLSLQGRKVWQNIDHGSALKDPALLNTFVVLLYADLKKHIFLYWFGFPALKFPEKIELASPVVSVKEAFSASQIDALKTAYDSSPANDDQFFAFRLAADGHCTDCVPLRCLHEEQSLDCVLLVFCDPSSHDQLPGWPLRNLLALYHHRWGREGGCVRVLCWRDVTRGGRRRVEHSLLLKLRLSRDNTAAGAAAGHSEPGVTGWQRNERGRPGPRLVNLASCMQPAQMARSAVDLNLKLMRWRLVPNLDLQAIARLKCLLVGAGTLGCNVARVLLGWGVRDVTFVDSGRVSYSNPARQSLFTFEDAAAGRFKAEAAAARLADIHPAVNGRGEILAVPMPGHPVSQACETDTLQHVRKLRQLVERCDVIFLLLDSREARWLPTLMAAAHGKLAINAALGFDSYLVMRHGLHAHRCDKLWRGGGECDAPVDRVRLGCYFCNDVVVPANSSVGRSLDQQCSVTRPGVSHVAAALAVEMAVALLQHPHRGFASAACETDSGGVLGAVPHSVRGSLGGSHHHMCPCTPAFNQCTACSPQVVERYLSEQGESFLLRVFNEPSYLEQVCGLTELHLTADNVQMIELDTDSTEDSDV